jgi:hypothetical protein
VERVGSLKGLGSIVVAGRNPISSRYCIEVVQGVANLAATGEAMIGAEAVQAVADAGPVHLMLATGELVPIRIVGVDSAAGSVIFNADVRSVSYRLPAAC